MEICNKIPVAVVYQEAEFTLYYHYPRLPDHSRQEAEADTYYIWDGQIRVFHGEVEILFMNALT